MIFRPPDRTALVEFIGSGSSFHVALVREGVDTLICKRPRGARAANADMLAGLERERLALQLASHPSLPSVIRSGTDADGAFLLQTRVVGTSIRELVRSWQAGGQRCSSAFLHHVVCSSLCLLAELHECPGAGEATVLVHGDISPDNVLVDEAGDAHFIDFGHARWRGMPSALAHDARGTLPYLAPEVARAEVLPTQASDVYALAATMLFVCTSARICDAVDEAPMLLEVAERGVRVDMLSGCDDLSAGEKSALARALSFDAAARTQTARAFLNDFEGRAEHR